MVISSRFVTRFCAGTIDDSCAADSHYPQRKVLLVAHLKWCSVLRVPRPWRSRRSLRPLPRPPASPTLPARHRQQKCQGGKSPFATSHPGIFAVGDVRAGSVKRVASAVGEGSVV